MGRHDANGDFPLPENCARRALARARPVANARRGSAPGPQAGVTLIEILVAVVLLSIGLLGLAGLQLRSMQVNQGSAMRSQAAIMAEDLADRMRADVLAANPTNAAGGFYGAYTPANQASAAPQSMQDWLANFGSTLPAGVAAAATPVPCAGNTLPCVRVWLPGGTTNLPVPVEIDVFWNDARAAKGADKNATAVVGQYTMMAYL